MKWFVAILTGVLCVSLAVSAPAAEYGRIALYADEAHSVNEVWHTGGPTPFTLYIFCLPGDDGMICAEYAVDFPGNVIVDSDWNMILIDHSQCFISRKGLPDDPEKTPSQFDRKLVKELRALRLDQLKILFSRYLLDSQVESILARRDALLEHMDQLVAEKGEKAVMY